MIFLPGKWGACGLNSRIETAVVHGIPRIQKTIEDIPFNNNMVEVNTALPEFLSANYGGVTVLNELVTEDIESELVRTSFILPEALGPRRTSGSMKDTTFIRSMHNTMH